MYAGGTLRNARQTETSCPRCTQFTLCERPTRCINRMPRPFYLWKGETSRNSNSHILPQTDTYARSKEGKVICPQTIRTKDQARKRTPYMRLFLPKPDTYAPRNKEEKGTRTCGYCYPKQIHTISSWWLRNPASSFSECLVLESNLSKHEVF